MNGYNFEERIKSLKEDEESYKKRSDRMSAFRLIEFVSGGALAYACFRFLGPPAGWIAIVSTIALFAFLVRKHGEIKRSLEWIRCMIKVNREYQDRMEGKWTSFGDRGQEFVDPGHPYSGDLDIFGDRSLFQAINTGKTHYGRIALKDRLSSPMKDPDLIKAYQTAIDEMARKLDFKQAIQCEAMLNVKTANDPEELLLYAEDGKTLFGNRRLENLFYILPAATILSVAFAILGILVPPGVPLILCALQIVIMIMGDKRLSPVFSKIGKFKDDIMAFRGMIGRIENESFDSPLLLELRERFLKSGDKASRRLDKLVGISEAMDIRYSPMLRFILNMLLLWDYHCIFAAEEWKKNNGGSARLWIKTVGEFEMLSSLAVLPGMYEGLSGRDRHGVFSPDVNPAGETGLATRRNGSSPGEESEGIPDDRVIKPEQPVWSFPDFTADGPGITAGSLGHPLIPADRRVCNDISVRKQICVITGSNMSGKTTLLRTIGINLVLAYAGAPVCAGRMTCSIMDIYTSMRINDDLNSGISTFYAELLRMKMIIERSRSRESMIFLIDEIFRGTNSTDRTVGAVKVLRALNRDWITGLISTHDFELCELEKEDKARIRNFHFRECYAGDRICFDYKLHPGRSETTNARFLMKMVGID